MGQAGAREAGLPADAVAAGRRPGRAAPRRASRWPRAAAVPISIICASQAPLHETADELCAVAKDLKLAPGRHPARRQRHRGDAQEAERPGQARPLPRAALRHPRHPGRRDRRHQRAWPDPDAAQRADRARRRLSVGLRGRRPQARCRLGDPVGLQHRGRRRRRAPRRCPAWRAPSSTPAPARCWSRTGRSTPPPP